MARTRIDTPDGGSYFEAPSREVEFFSSGCQLFDCVLGGGYPLGRIVNIVGDKSTGKTLLAIEACANFLRAFPKGEIYYNEAEAAFDKGYAKALGMPLNRVTFVEDCGTVEDLFEDLRLLLRGKERNPVLYILDSLDALSDRAEAKRDIDEGSFGAAKAKKMSEMFRRLVRKIKNRRVCVIIISQTRDAIGVMFGNKVSRSGGKALDFYASQVVMLSQVKTLRRTVQKTSRVTGIVIKAKCTKNKIGLPLRDCEFPIIFGYGVDDVAAGVKWLEEIDRLDKDLARRVDKAESADAALRSEVAAAVRTNWRRIEVKFLPPRSKYGGL